MPEYDDAYYPFTVRVDREIGEHTWVTVWDRGGFSGQLVVLTADAPELIRRLTQADSD